jgi:hypothetical protein
MDCLNYFAHDYSSARLKFREAAGAAGGELVIYENGGETPDGENLSTDVALLGDPAARGVLVANAGTHGVEGFCGSGALVGWLRSARYRALDDGVRVVLVHALNPHGFAWLRRVNEDNVDLNRNFVDHDGDYPIDPDYAALHPFLLPETWDEASSAAFDEAWSRIQTERGQFAAQAILSRGQYHFSDGVFFGGNAPTWSNQTFRNIVDRFVRGAPHVAFIDFHTGLGPYGTAELIHREPAGTPARQRLDSWYRHGLTSLPDGTTSSAASPDGLVEAALVRSLAESETTALTMEFGTYPMPRVLTALRADNWLHLRGDPESALGRHIKADIRECFYPDEDDWKELVFLRARQIMDRAVWGLSRAA